MQGFPQVSGGLKCLVAGEGPPLSSWRGRPSLQGNGRGNTVLNVKYANKASIHSSIIILTVLEKCYKTVRVIIDE